VAPRFVVVGGGPDLSDGFVTSSSGPFCSIKMEVTVPLMAGRPHTLPDEALHGRTLAAHLRNARRERGWSRAVLSAESGIPQRTLVRLETEGTADPGVFVVAALASCLGVSLDELAATAMAPRLDLVSAGYEGASIEDFIADLKARGVQQVADVRLTPLSRKPGFSKKRLAACLEEQGIEYRHLRGLGNPKDNRPPFYDGRIEEGKAVFRQLLETSEQAGQDLAELVEAARGSRVAVLCFEADEQRCHRQVVLEAARSLAVA
jgi:transcriptional regulator with XRE-family HTH domain